MQATREVAEAILRSLCETLSTVGPVNGATEGWVIPPMLFFLQGDQPVAQLGIRSFRGAEDMQMAYTEALTLAAALPGVDGIAWDINILFQQTGLVRATPDYNPNEDPTIHQGIGVGFIRGHEFEEVIAEYHVTDDGSLTVDSPHPPEHTFSDADGAWIPVLVGAVVASKDAADTLLARLGASWQGVAETLAIAGHNVAVDLPGQAPFLRVQGLPPIGEVPDCGDPECQAHDNQRRQNPGEWRQEGGYA